MRMPLKNKAGGGLCWTLATAALSGLGLTVSSASSVETARLPFEPDPLTRPMPDSVPSNALEGAVHPDGMSWRTNQPPRGFKPGTILRRTSCKNLVAITFDDGPNESSPELLRVLNEHGVRCTFFGVGERIKAQPELISELVGNGNELGNHSFNHRTKNMSLEAQYGSMAATQKIIERLTGKRAWYYRPPGGVYDKRTLEAAGAAGCQVIYWSIDPRDWSPKTTKRQLLQTCLTATGGDIILLHDRPGTAALLPAIIEGLRQKGLEPVTVSELLNASSD